MSPSKHSSSLPETTAMKGWFAILLAFIDAMPLTAKLAIMVLVTMDLFFLVLFLSSTYLRW